VKTGLLLFILLLLPALTQAEYRVFVLKISKISKDSSIPASSRTLESTLDPDQYRGYYTVEADETVTYNDTWRCRGRTNDLPLCPNPRNPASTQGPDSASNSPP
jgi:hypothetical protein